MYSSVKIIRYSICHLTLKFCRLNKLFQRSKSMQFLCKRKKKFLVKCTPLASIIKYCCKVLQYFKIFITLTCIYIVDIRRIRIFVRKKNIS